MDRQEKDSFMFGIHTDKNILLFGDFFSNIEEADFKSQQFENNLDLINYYGVKKEWLFSPIKIFNLKNLEEYNVFYKNDLNNWKKVFAKDLQTVIALRYPEINYQNINEYLKKISTNDMRNLLLDYNNDKKLKLLK